MTLFYLDASAWVKYYVVEAGSVWIDRFWNLRAPCACSDLGLIEVLVTLARRQKRKAALSGSYGQAIRDVHR
jgi:predicted nucleic acid-binding protein